MAEIKLDTPPFANEPSWLVTGQLVVRIGGPSAGEVLLESSGKITPATPRQLAAAMQNAERVKALKGAEKCKD